MHSPLALRVDGPMCARKRGRWPSESKRCRTKSAGNNRGAEHTPRPASRLLIPRLPHPVADSQTRAPTPQAGRARRGAVRAVTRKAHLKMSGSRRVPFARNWGYALPPRVGAPPPLILTRCRHPWCSK